MRSFIGIKEETRKRFTAYTYKILIVLVEGSGSSAFTEAAVGLEDDYVSLLLVLFETRR